MALLVQVVEGEKIGHYYLPQLAGVAFSHNQYRWSPQIRAEDGFIRLVWGLGTRAVDRVGNDYPRLIALSHPTLRPSSTTKSIRRYSQQYVDLIDLQKNKFDSLPIHKVLNLHYKPLRYLAQSDMELFQVVEKQDCGWRRQSLILTFETSCPHRFCRNSANCCASLRYRSPVDVEFTAPYPHQSQPRVASPSSMPSPEFSQGRQPFRIPDDIDPQDKVFSSSIMVSGGHLDEINYVHTCPPGLIFNTPSPSVTNWNARSAELNTVLVNENLYVSVGRWGTSNPDLGYTWIMLIFSTASAA